MAAVLDALITDLVAAGREGTPQLAVRDVLERHLRAPQALADALPGRRAELVALHVSEEISVFKAVWAEGMHVPPHDHRMWGAIGVYGGREDNEFFRRAGGRIEASGGRALTAGDVALMGAETIHAVTAPVWTGAIHVYGGDFVRQPRSIWIDGVEEPNDGARTAAIFEAANAPSR